MSKNQITVKQNSDNQRVLEEWVKRNNTDRIIIKPNNAGLHHLHAVHSIQNGKQPIPIIVSVTKKDNKNENSRKSNKLPNKRTNTRSLSLQSNVIKPKIARWSSPAVSIKIEPANIDAVPKSEKKESCSDSEQSTTSKQGPKPVQSSDYLKRKLPSLKQVPTPAQSPKYLKGKSPALNDVKKICVPTKKVGTKNGKSHAINQKNISNSSLKDEQDVYSSIQDNYKHLSTPNHWSVTEFENDSFKQCIVFSKPHVVNENEKLITVMQKSLIIDKSGTIHYSVHGLPVNVKGTILPDILDSIKKLLSIVHIFDKMQVCKGLGDDLSIVKTDNLLKDICQVWRHTDCKLLLVKADQCQICLDSRNMLLEKEMLFKSELLSTEFVDTKVKQELN